MHYYYPVPAFFSSFSSFATLFLFYEKFPFPIFQSGSSQNGTKNLSKDTNDVDVVVLAFTCAIGQAVSVYITHFSKQRLLRYFPDVL